MAKITNLVISVKFLPFKHDQFLSRPAEELILVTIYLLFEIRKKSTIKQSRHNLQMLFKSPTNHIQAKTFKRFLLLKLSFKAKHLQV